MLCGNKAQLSSSSEARREPRLLMAFHEKVTRGIEVLYFWLYTLIMLWN